MGRPSVSRETLPRRNRPFHVKRWTWAATGLLIAVGVLFPSPSGAQPGVPGTPGGPVLPDRSDVPPPGYTRTARDVMRLAAATPEVRQARAENRPVYTRAYISGSR